jgi:glyoxylate carboligase
MTERTDTPMNGARYVVRQLRALGVTTVYGYPGGAIMPLYDALYDGGIRHILTRHEQGAALAAIGHARSTSQTGVCLATSGPGATNLITGLADGLAHIAGRSRSRAVVEATAKDQGVEKGNLQHKIDERAKHGFISKR